MKLIEAIKDLASLDEECTIYAAEPWTPDSEVVLAEEPESGRAAGRSQKTRPDIFP